MTGGERSTRNQTTAHRSVYGCAPSRDAQSHCTDRALQRRVNSAYFRIIVPCTTFYVNLLLKKTDSASTLVEALKAWSVLSGAWVKSVCALLCHDSW